MCKCSKSGLKSYHERGSKVKYCVILCGSKKKNLFCLKSPCVFSLLLPQNQRFAGLDSPSNLEGKACPSRDLKDIFVPLESIKSST